MSILINRHQHNDHGPDPLKIRILKCFQIFRHTDRKLRPEHALCPGMQKRKPKFRKDLGGNPFPAHQVFLDLSAAVRIRGHFFPYRDQKLLKGNVIVYLKKFHIFQDRLDLYGNQIDLLQLHGKLIFLFVLFRHSLIPQDHFPYFFHVLLIQKRIHGNDRDILGVHGNRGNQKICFSDDVRRNIIFSVCRQDHPILIGFLQLGHHQTGDPDPAGADHSRMDLPYIFPASLQAEYRRAEMYRQETNLLFRHLPLRLLLQNRRHMNTFPVNLRVALPDLRKHGILNMHSIYDPDQGRLQMRQKPLDKFLVLFEQACLHWVKGIDHLIDQILQLPVFNRQGFPGIPPYPLMLGALNMQADVGNLHRRKADSEFLFQLRRDLLRQKVILIPFKLFPPAATRLDRLILEDPVNGNGNMDHEPHIGIFRQGLYLEMIHPCNTADHTFQYIVVQHLPDLAFQQKILRIQHRGFLLIGFPQYLRIYIFFNKRADRPAVILLASIGFDSASRLPADLQAIPGQPAFHSFQVRADRSLTDTELAAVIIQLFQPLFSQQFQDEPLPPLLPVAHIVRVSLAEFGKKTLLFLLAAFQPDAHASL